MIIYLIAAHPGNRCKPKRACVRRSIGRLGRSLAVLPAGLWRWLAAEWAEVAYVERELRGMLTDQLPADPAPAPRRPVNGRYLGTMPRLATADRAPFTEVDMPALPDPEPGPAWGDPGDGLGPDVPIARPYAPEPTWNETCQLAVLAAAQNPALRDQPVVPAYMSAPAGGAE